MATEPVTKIERSIPTQQLSMNETRGILTESILGLRSGDTTPSAANAISNAIGKYLSTVRLEMDYQRQSGRKGAIPLLDASTAAPTDEQA